MENLPFFWYKYSYFFFKFWDILLTDNKEEPKKDLEIFDL